jgi:hypothetical protein
MDPGWVVPYGSAGELERPVENNGRATLTLVSERRTNRCRRGVCHLIGAAEAHMAYNMSKMAFLRWLL